MKALKLAPLQDWGLPLLAFNAECSTWALNTYSRCDHACKYCITGVQGASTPKYPKELVVERLRRELVDVDLDESIGIGGLCDAYPHVEEQHGVTRAVIAELVAQDRPFSIITKGLTIWRDVDLLVESKKCSVSISLSTVEEWALASIDPNAPSAAERLELIAKLRDAGVKVSVAAMPWIPEISDARAIIFAVPPGVPVYFAPLNVVSAPVAKSAFGKRYEQAEINEAYRIETKRIGLRENVVWLHPVPLEGWGEFCAISHLDNLQKHRTLIRSFQSPRAPAAPPAPAGSATSGTAFLSL